MKIDKIFYYLVVLLFFASIPDAYSMAMFHRHPTPTPTPTHKPTATYTPVRTNTPTSTNTPTPTPVLGWSIPAGGVVGLKSKSQTQTTDPFILDSRIHGSVCAATWAQVEPIQGTFDWSILDTCVAVLEAVGKVSVISVEASAGDTGMDLSALPAWTTGKFGIAWIAGSTNKFPIWWDHTYQLLWINVLTHLFAHYGSDSHVMFLTTGYSGTPPVSLAGEQSTALCAQFTTAGYTGDCMNPTATGAFADSVMTMLTSWQTSRNVRLSVMRPVTTGSLAERMANQLFLKSSPAPSVSLNNGCSDSMVGIVTNWQKYQLVGNGGGCFGVAVNYGITVTGLDTLVAQLNKNLFVMFMSGSYWTNNDAVLTEAATLLKP